MYKRQLQYCPSYVSRETGPSIGDINVANSQQLPGLLYDYEDEKIYGEQDWEYGPLCAIVGICFFIYWQGGAVHDAVSLLLRKYTLLP